MNDLGGLRPAGWAATVAVVVLLAMPSGTSASAATAVLKTGLPNRTLTPGLTNPAVTQANIKSTICVAGWAASIRPSSSYATALKRSQLALYGFSDRTLSHYDEDHLIPLDLGGAAKNARNLWPEPYHIRIAGGLDVGSYTKDAFEKYLKGEVCAGRRSLRSAQQEIAVNWVAYWKAWKSGAGSSPKPTPTPSPTPSTSNLVYVVRGDHYLAVGKAGNPTIVTADDGTLTLTSDPAVASSTVLIYGLPTGLIPAGATVLSIDVRVCGSASGAFWELYGPSGSTPVELEVTQPATDGCWHFAAPGPDGGVLVKAARATTIAVAKLEYTIHLGP